MMLLLHTEEFTLLLLSCSVCPAGRKSIIKEKCGSHSDPLYKMYHLFFGSSSDSELLLALEMLQHANWLISSSFPTTYVTLLHTYIILLAISLSPSPGHHNVDF